jgi:hypothetical protein
MAHIRSQFSGLKYAGKADGDKRAYHVFEGAASMLVVSPGRTRGSYNANAVDRRGLDVVGRRFRGRKVTSADVMRKARRRDLFRQRFDALNALYAMVAVGRAQKLRERRDGRSLVFRILR